MSELYLIFFLIGIGLFLFVVVYSIFKKKQQQRPLNRQTDSYVENAGEPNQTSQSVAKEPTIDAQEPNQSEKVSLKQQIANRVIRNKSTDDKAQTPVEPSIEETPTDSESSLSNDVKPRIDAASSTVVTELVAKVKNPLPIEQHELLTLFRMHDFKFHRNVHIFGLNQLTENWRDIEFELPTARFVELGVSIELADREGAMTQKELHDFQQMVLDFSNKFDAPFEFSMGIDDAFEQGQTLDKIGRRYDSMAVLNVIPKTSNGFRTADVESCARDLMMSSDKNGIFLKTIGQKDNISVLYRLACTDGAGHYGSANHATALTHDLVMYMNVPATSEPQKVFEEMVKDANSLATWLEGKVVDQHRRAMTQRSYTLLMQQIVDITNNMNSDGLAPGDLVSKKLF